MSRKVVLSLVLVVVLAPNATFGQSKVGIIAGMNRASMTTSGPSGTIDDWSRRSVIGVGGFLEHQFSESAAIRVEVLYLGKGGRSPSETLVYGGLVVSAVTEIKMSYVQIPVNFIYSFGAGTIRPFVIIGPSLAFSTSARFEVTAVSIQGVEFEEFDLSDAVTATEIGLGFGGGLRFPGERLDTFVQVRYAVGITDIGRDGNLDIAGETFYGAEPEWTTNGIEVMVGIAIPLSN